MVAPPDRVSTDQKLSRTMKKAQKWHKLNQDHMIMEKGKTLERNQTRDWKVGDIYSPHDLSPSEMKKWRKKQSPSTDAFDALSLNPLHQYKVRSPSLCSTLPLSAKHVLIIQRTI